MFTWRWPGPLVSEVTGGGYPFRSLNYSRNTTSNYWNCWEKGFNKTTNSNHKLVIEIGRYSTKDYRHCPFCGSNLIEDEVHFLFRYPTYSMIRNNLIFTIKSRLWFQYYTFTSTRFINGLTNSSNFFINIQFMKYISARFDLRDKLLPK